MNFLQSGIGIDISGADLRAICVKRRFSRVKIHDRLVIPDYRSRSPQECGALYADFVTRNGLQLPWTVVALPRSAVLLRSLSLPSAAEKELRSAVEFQIDSLHPFEEGDVYWDVSAVKSSSARIEAPVVIAQKQYVDSAADWFRDAGIAVSQFTATATALAGALTPRISFTLLCVNLLADSAEVIGHANGAAVLSRDVGTRDPVAVARELERMRSELRLPPESRPTVVVCGHDARAFLQSIPADAPFGAATAREVFAAIDGAESEIAEGAVALAAALMAVDHTGPFAINLLPVARRSYRSPWMYLPAYALSSLVVVLAVALALRGTIQDWQYLRYLDGQLATLQPQIRAAEAAQDQSRGSYDRLALLTGFRSSATVPLEILNELTAALPRDVWVEQMLFDGTTLTLAGYADSASHLLQVLAANSYFDSPQFLSPVRRMQEGKEAFRIGVRLRRSQPPRTTS